MERLYCVTFYTQRDRRFIHWEYFVHAHSMKEAKEIADDRWYSDDNPKYTYEKNGKYYPHMFHVNAKRVTESIEKETNKFYQVSNEYAYWGNK